MAQYSGLLLICLVALAACSDDAQPRPLGDPQADSGFSARSCGPVSDSLRTPESARLAAGAYAFVIVSTVGSTAGASAQGRLILHPTRPSDRSPRTGQHPRSDEDRERTPLYGSLDADLTKVGAPLPDGRNADEPLPSSTDPLFPGVLVHVQLRPTERQQNVLTVATSINARVDLGYGVADGPGIFLRVRELTPAAFAGTWAQGGLEEAGGYFCARRLGG
jgi:hypothetical protein